MLSRLSSTFRRTVCSSGCCQLRPPPLDGCQGRTHVRPPSRKRSHPRHLEVRLVQPYNSPIRSSQPTPRRPDPAAPRFVRRSRRWCAQHNARVNRCSPGDRLVGVVAIRVDHPRDLHRPQLLLGHVMRPPRRQDEDPPRWNESPQIPTVADLPSSVTKTSQRVSSACQSAPGCAHQPS